MIKRADLLKGTAVLVLTLLLGFGAQAQCPNTAMSITQTASVCGADVNYAVTNDVGFQSVQYTLNGNFLSDQQAGTVPLNPGTYSFEVITIDQNNCTSVFEEEVTVVSPTGLAVDIVVQSYPCVGQCTGSLMAAVTGGTPPYSYVWMPGGQTTLMINNMCEGPYTVIVTDANGCSVQASMQLNESSLSAQLFLDTTYTCSIGACDATASVLVSGGTSPYTYQWADPMVQTTATATGLCSSVFPYPVIITDANGCSVQVEVLVLEGPPPVQSYSITSEVLYENCEADICFGLPEGIIDHTWLVNGAPPPISEQCLSNGWLQEDDQIDLMVIDSFGCTHSTPTVIVEVPADPTISVIILSDTIACNGDLQMDMNTTGGSGDYAFAWEPASLMSDPTAEFPTVNVGVDTVEVSVTVTDNVTGCSATESTTVFPNVPVNATIELCGEDAELSVDPGSSSYDWTATDPNSNAIDVSAFQGMSTLVAEEAGTYIVMTSHLGCNGSPVTHVFEVEECTNACNSSFTYTQNCYQVCFSADGSPDIESYWWDFDDGAVSNLEEPCHFFPIPGTYTVQLTAIHTNSCTSTYTESVVILENDPGSLQIALEDTVYTCAGTCEATATAIVTGGTPPYSYVWWSDGNTTATNDFMCAGTDTVEVWDSNGCMVSEEVEVVMYPVQELDVTYSMTVENCLTTMCFDSYPGFLAYDWLMSNGANFFTHQFCFQFNESGDFNATLWVTDEFGCQHDTVVFFTVPECEDDVWPGDVNSDGIADNADVTWLGLAYDQTGPVRPDASLLWEGQPAPDWNFNFTGINVNLKHADTDGNGTVNYADTIAISQNYGQTHGKWENAAAGGSPELWVVGIPDTVGLSQSIDLTVYLATAELPVDSLHGIAFTLNFDATLVSDEGLSIDFSDNVLGTVGTDVMTLQKPFLADGAIDLAITRNTLENFSGHGPLVNARIVTTDNLSGIHELRIGVSDVTAITAHGHAVELNSIADTVVIDPAQVGIASAVWDDLRVWPNPSRGIFRVQGLQPDMLLEVMDATGRIFLQKTNNGHGAMDIDMATQPDGFYLLRISGKSGVATRRIGVLRD